MWENKKNNTYPRESYITIPAIKAIYSHGKIKNEWIPLTASGQL